MKIAILTIGTRGDVQPYIALAKGLQSAGHGVILAGPDNFADWVEGHGIAFHPMGIDMEAFLQMPDVQAVIGGNFLKVGKVMRAFRPIVGGMLEAIWEAAKDADVILYHPKALAGVDVAEATGAAVICTSPIPMYPTSEFPFVLSRKSLGPTLNRLSYAPLNLSRIGYRKPLDRWRKETLGLGPGPTLAPLGYTNHGLSPRLCAVSPAVIPRPADWDDGLHMTGYWFLDEGADWQPDPELAAFLDAGPPPVYIGFGSMTASHPEKTSRLIVEAVKRSGVRALLAKGWGGLSEVDLPDDIHMIGGAPHHVLFPRVAAVVHHGGAGSTAAGLRAGRPTLICPFGVDQPFWGGRVHRLGCGPKPLKLKRATVDTLATRLADLVGNESYRTNASNVARGIAQDDGIAKAMEVITAARPDLSAAPRRSPVN